jgi:hypothetical protein
MSTEENPIRHDALFHRMAIALRMAYLHHHQLDPDVSALDVDALLHDVLVQVMGPTAFQRWLAEARTSARREES